MSNEFNVAVKLQADASQYTAEFTRAGRTAQAFAAELNSGSAAAAGGLYKATAQAQRFGTTASAAAGQAQQGMAAATSATQALDTAMAKVNKTASSTQLGASLGAVAKESQSATQALGAADRQAQALGISAKQTAAAMRGVPAQITDIVVGLQGGQAPMTVLLQQGGQLKDMFGGIVPAVRALVTTALGLVNPFILAGGAAAVLALAYKQGSAEADDFRRAILMSGNAAGTSVAQLADMARAVSANIGTQNEAAAVLAQMASGGRIAGDNLQYFTEVAMGLERYVGVPVKATIADLEELGKAPLAASVKLNEQYRYLTVAVYEQIKALDEQGRKEEAAAVAQNAFAKAFESRKNEMKANLGYLERAWYSLGNAAKWSWDQILNVGRATTDQQNLEQLKENLARLQERNANVGIKEGKQTQDLKDQIKALEQKIAGERQVAEEQGKQSKQTELRAEWDKVVLANLSKEKKLAQEIAEIRAKGAAAGIDKAEIDKQVKAHQDKNADKSGASAVAEAEKDALNARIEATRQGYKLLAAETADGLDAIDALRQQGLLSEYAALQRSTALRLQEIDSHKAALNAELGELQGRKNMARERAAVEGQLAELEQKRINLQNASARDLDTLLIKPQLALVSSMRQGATAANEQAAALEAQNSVYGLASSALADLSIAQLEQQRLDLEATDNVIPGYIAALEDRIAAQKRLRAAMADKEAKDWAKEQAEAAVKANDRATQAIERQNEQLAQSLTDNIMRGGKDAGDYVEDYFRSLVLRPLVQAIMSPVSMVINGVAGNVLGGGSSSGSSGIGTAINGASMISRVGAGFGAFGGAFSSGLGMALNGGMGVALEGGMAMLGSASGLSSAMAGIGQIAGALGPIALGVGALYAIWKKLDDSGTYHTGGAARYSASGGLDAGQSGADFNIGFGRVESGKETISAVSSIAKGLSTTFDSLAKTFGGKIGYEISAAYADDTSKDRAWGGLAIRRNGVELANWNNNRESKWAPREFADGEAGYKEYLKAVAQEARSVMLDPNNFDLPSWGRKIVEELGDDTDMDALTAAVEQINSIQAAFEQLGMGIKGFADMTDEAFAAIMQASGGIEALSSNASAYYDLFYSAGEKRDATRKQISSRFAELGLDAIDFDAPDAQARFRRLVDEQMALANQQAAIAIPDIVGNLTASLSELPAGGDLAATLSAALRDNGVTGDIEALTQGLAGIAGTLNPADFQAQATAMLEASGATSTAASETVAGLLQLASSFAQVTMTADDATAAAQREADAKERAAKEAQARAEQEAQARRDATDAAWAVVEKAIDAAREAAQVEADLAQERVTAAKALIDLTRDAVRDLRAEVESTSAMSVAAANAFIDNALATAARTGYLPESAELSQAISTARSGMATSAYRSRLDYEAAQLILANKLEAMGDIGQAQLSTDELLLEQAKAEVERLDQLHKDNQDALDAARGNLVATKDVATAVRDFRAALLKENTGSGSGGPAGGGTGGTGGGSSGSRPVFGPGGGGSSAAKYYSLIYGGTAGVGRQAIIDEALIAELDRLSPLYHSFDGTDNVKGLLESIREAGGTMRHLSILSGFWESDWRKAGEAVGIPAFDVGINRVPYDMDARIHQDELIVPAKFNPFNPGATSPWGASNASGNSDVVAAIGALQEQHYRVGRQMLEYLRTLETLARKSDIVGVKPRETA